MKLEKPDNAAYVRCLEINRQCFIGTERAPDGLFLTYWDAGDVFVHTLAGGLIAGFAIVSRKAGVPYIWTIAVHPAHRGMGIGSSLLQEIGWWAQSMNFSAIELTVRTDNPAQKLYFDTGYRVVKFLRRYYLNDGDGLLMRRVL